MFAAILFAAITLSLFSCHLFSGKKTGEKSVVGHWVIDSVSVRDSGSSIPLDSTNDWFWNPKILLNNTIDFKTDSSFKVTNTKDSVIISGKYYVDSMFTRLVIFDPKDTKDTTGMQMDFESDSSFALATDSLHLMLRKQ